MCCCMLCKNDKLVPDEQDKKSETSVTCMHTAIYWQKGVTFQ